MSRIFQKCCSADGKPPSRSQASGNVLPLCRSRQRMVRVPPVVFVPCCRWSRHQLSQNFVAGQQNFAAFLPPAPVHRKLLPATVIVQLKQDPEIATSDVVRVLFVQLIPPHSLMYAKIKNNFHFYCTGFDNLLILTIQSKIYHPRGKSVRNGGTEGA